MTRIFLLTDYRGQFYSSTKQRGIGVDLVRLAEYFKKLNFDLVVMPFSEVDLRTQNYKNEWVLYQSSEDPDLFYRSYIEDIILGLFLQGARLIPDIYKFRAHHNKHFMEILRDVFDMPEIKNIKSDRYGTYEDYLDNIDKFKNGSYVLKSSNTSKSRGVFLLKNIKDKLTIPKKISHTFSLRNIRYYFERLRTGKKPLYISNNRKKFIIQPYINSLRGDYRVVVYGDKFYILYRSNRKNDFRASGSMMFNYEIELPPNLLNFAKKIFDGFNVPYIALDIGVSGDNFFIFEFQFLSFGQYTLEKSKFFYRLEDKDWIKVFEEPDLEREISISVMKFINKSKS